MRHTIRMFLVPEEIFNSIAKPQETSDGTPIGLVRSRIQQIEKGKGLNVDAKAAHYQQEFKRLNKLIKDQEEKPLDVRVQNISEIVPPPPPSQQKTPKNVQKHQKTPKAKQQKSVTKQENDEMEEWLDASSEASPPKIKSSEAQSTSATSVDEQPKTTTTNRTMLMEHIHKNGSKLGLNSEGKILRTYDGQPYKTSSIEEIVTYLLNEDKRSHLKNLPVGYKDFAERAKGDPFLAKYLFKTPQSGKGPSFLNFNKYKKVNRNRRPFIFRPSLWY